MLIRLHTKLLGIRNVQKKKNTFVLLLFDAVFDNLVKIVKLV